MGLFVYNSFIITNIFSNSLWYASGTFIILYILTALLSSSFTLGSVIVNKIPSFTHINNASSSISVKAFNFLINCDISHLILDSY